jgi:hypothetical protein
MQSTNDSRSLKYSGKVLKPRSRYPNPMLQNASCNRKGKKRTSSKDIARSIEVEKKKKKGGILEYITMKQKERW